VAVPPKERAPFEPRQLDALMDEKLREVVRPPGQARRVIVVGQEAAELGLERRDAARLDVDERDARADLVAELVEDPPEVAPREVEHPVVVQRAAAAQMLTRHHDVVPRSFEDLDGRDAHAGVEVVVERVGPQDDPRSAVVPSRPR